MQANAWAARSGRPQARAGRDRGGRRGQSSAPHPGAGGRAVVVLLTLAAGREARRPSGLGRAPRASAAPARRALSAHSRRGREEVSLRCRPDLLGSTRAARKEGTDTPAPGPGRLRRRPGAEPRGGGPSVGPAGSAAIQAVFCSLPRPRRALSPTLQPPPPVAVAAVAPAPRPPHPAPRHGHTLSHPGRLRPALCGAASGASDRRGLLPPRTVGALGARPAYLWLPAAPAPTPPGGAAGVSHAPRGFETPAPRWGARGAGSCPHWGGEGLPRRNGTK